LEDLKHSERLTAPHSAEMELKAGRRHNCDTENVLEGSAQQ